MKPPIKRPRLLAAGTLLCVSIAALVVYLSRINPAKEFADAASSVASNPEKWIGRQTGLSTYIEDQPPLRDNITSEEICRQVIGAYQLLKTQLQPTPATYFSEVASMPIQETIWQFPGYFVRLYVTPSLDSDGAAVGVFAGSYKEFRKESISGINDGFVPAQFASPEKFLARR